MLYTQIQVKPKDGLKTTLAIMQHLESLAIANPKFVKFVHDQFGSDCVACIPGKIWAYIKNNFEYVSDDPFDEIITAPYILLETKKGDCDDFSLFAKTCIDILGGFYSHYLLLGKKQNSFSHVVCFVHRGRVNNLFRDPVVIDGANDLFNSVNTNVYKFQKII